MIGELSETELEQLKAHALEAQPGVCAVEARELLELISGYRRGKVPRFNVLRAGYWQSYERFDGSRMRWSGTIEEALAKQEALAASGVAALVVLDQKGSSRS